MFHMHSNEIWWHVDISNIILYSLQYVCSLQRHINVQQMSDTAQPDLGLVSCGNANITGQINLLHCSTVLREHNQKHKTLNNNLYAE